MFLILGLIFFALAGRLFSLQVLQRDWYRSQADRRLTRMPEVIPTRRGSILDRNGIELAKDSAAWDIGVYYPFITMRERFVARLADRWQTDPAHVRDRVAEMWRDLSEVTGVSPAELQRRQTVIARRVVQIKRAVERRTRPGIVIAEETYGRRGSVAHAIVKDVDKRVMSIVGSQPERFFGLAVIETSKREFPYNDAACHVIGRLGRVFEEQFASQDNINEPYPVGHLKRYFLDDMIGQGGVEESREALLRGSRGIRQFGIERNLLKSIEP
ncbi:MAG: hypothetical protein QF662_08945, partial [Phycisphaerae bacterium]|nr:hypothetical protein [Phycisphaerae bacterium]